MGFNPEHTTHIVGLAETIATVTEKNEQRSRNLELALIRIGHVLKEHKVAVITGTSIVIVGIGAYATYKSLHHPERTLKAELREGGKPGCVNASLSTADTERHKLKGATWQMLLKRLASRSLRPSAEGELKDD